MASVKVDLGRELGELYRAVREPAIVDVPELPFLMIDGAGDPNTSLDYRDAVKALYSASYTLKFTLKQSGEIDYKVMPLESLWWVRGATRFDPEAKSAWRWTAMILQPDQVTGDLVTQAIASALEKQDLPAVSKLALERYREGLAAQVMHVGPYAEEWPAIARLHTFIAEQGLAPAGKHHEIYLGDPRRTAPEKLRTIIRQPAVRR